MGGGKSTTTVTSPPPTQQELDLLDAQLRALERTEQQQIKFGELTEPILEQQAQLLEGLLSEAQSPEAQELQRQQLALATQQAAQAERLLPIQEEVANRQLELLRQGNRATPEELEDIASVTDAAIAAGEGDIERFELDALERIREELAPSLGLRPTDAPILLRGERIGQEGLRLRGDLEKQLRSAQITAGVNLPLAREQLFSGVGGFQQELSRSINDFQQRLRDQAFQNRLSLSGSANPITAANLGLGLASAAGSTQSILQQNRLSNRTSTTNTSGGGLGLAIQGVGAVGGLLSGIGSFKSSKSLKDFIADIDDDEILEAFDGLSVQRWRYKSDLPFDDEEHIGAYAEDLQAAFDIGDGRTINVIDAIGLLMSAVKALKGRVEAVDHG